MIIKFKIFESDIYKYDIIDADNNFNRNTKELLCIDNHIGILKNTYYFTIGKNIK